MSGKIVETALAPKAMGPFSQAAIYKNVLYISAQNGALPIDGSIPVDFESQVKNALYNVKAVVEAAGSRLNRVVKVTVYLTDMSDFHKMNALYGKFFRDELPARDVVGVNSLPKGALIQISAMAFVRDDA